LITKLKTARRVGPRKIQPDDTAVAAAGSTPTPSAPASSTVPPSTAKAS